MIRGTGEHSALTVSRERRLEILSGIWAFRGLQPEEMVTLADRLSQDEFAPGRAVVVEGMPGDRLYFIHDGRAEVSTTGAGGRVPLQALGPGEMFGEIALLTPGGTRQATVTALTPLTTLSIAAVDFQQLLTSHPQVEAELHSSADSMLTAKFLKQASPFTTLDLERLAWLAGRLEQVNAEPGESIIRQGESGDACYLLCSGKVEVVVRDESAPQGERRVATLGRGALFGESALLTDSPRNATIRALDPSELLVLRRSDLVEAMETDEEVSGRVLEQVGQRDRPHQVPGIVASHVANDERQTITTLKDPKRNSYLRLSEDGWFVWQRLDGRHTLEDIARDYEREFGAFVPLGIAEMVGRMVEAGFVETAELREDVLPPAQPGLWQRIKAFFGSR